VCFAKKSTFFDFVAYHFAFLYHFAFSDNGEGAPLGANRRVSGIEKVENGTRQHCVSRD
jgi:hypothetical protein